MSTQYKTLDELLAQDISGKTVLIRCDLNVPIDKKTGTILDVGRIDASIPTLKKLLAAQAKVIIMSHLGRPDGQPNPQLSLAPIAQALTERLGKTVQFAHDTIGQDALARIEGLLSGDCLLLENVRFDQREMAKDDGERQQYAKDLIDIIGDDALFVSDGFGVVHRKQASVYDIAEILPAYAGSLISVETQVLQKLLEHPVRPYVVILGGAKVSDKLGVIESLAPLVDALLIVGGMTYTFLAAQGYEIGSSLVEPHFIDSAKELLAKYPHVLHLPLDTVVADAFAADAHTQLVSSTEIPADMMGLDIGPATVAAFAEVIATAKTIFWNGPAGVFEMEPFAHGTAGIARAIIAATEENQAFSVIGGGDSAAAVRALGLDENKFSHISTGGGASLEFLEGKTLPGLVVLESN